MAITINMYRKFKHVLINERTDKRTDTQIAIIRIRIGGEVEMGSSR